MRSLLPLIHRYQPQVEQARALGAPFTHAEALKAVATQNGFTTWDQLQAEPPRSFRLFGRAQPWKPAPVVHLDELLFNLKFNQVQLGMTPNQREVVSQDLHWARRHQLLVGPNGKGANATLEFLMAQHIARDGGLLVLDSAPNYSTPVMLARVAAACGRTDFQHYPLTENLTEPTLNIDQLYCSAGAAYVNLPQDPQLSVAQLAAQQLIRKLEVVGQSSRTKLDITPQPVQADRAKQPLMVVVPDGGWLITDAWRSLLQNARAYNLQLVVRLHNMADLRDLNPAVADSVLNFDTKMFWAPASPAAREDAARVLAKSQDPEKLSEVYDLLASLELAEGLMTLGGEPERFRSCLMVPETRAQTLARRG